MQGLWGRRYGRLAGCLFQRTDAALKLLNSIAQDHPFVGTSGRGSSRPPADQGDQHGKYEQDACPNLNFPGKSHRTPLPGRDFLFPVED